MICHRLRDAASGLKGRLIPALRLRELRPLSHSPVQLEMCLSIRSGQVYEQRNLDGFISRNLATRRSLGPVDFE